MIKYIEIDIPQLIILPELNYNNVSKKFKNEMGQFFLWSYLNEKFTDFSIRHYVMNEQLREIFLTHTENIESRIKDEMYSMDKNHYTQLFNTGQVCKCIASNVVDLCYCIYFMKYIQIEAKFPNRTEIPEAIDFIMKLEDLKAQLSKFSMFITEADEIRQAHNLNIIRPGYDFFITEKEPVYFVTSNDGTLSIRLLRKFIEEYNSFFLTSKNILRHHSPEAIGHSLEKWEI